MSSRLNLTIDSFAGSSAPPRANPGQTETYLLYGVALAGLAINLLTMFFLLIVPAYRMKSSCFLFHHCLICLTLSMLCLPYALSFSHYSIRCDYLGNIQVTCVTAQLLNMAAMVASEAYRFEDLIHQETSSDHQQVAFNSSDTHSNFSIPSNKKSTEHHHYFEYQLKQSNKSTISCGCLSFGILIIWFSSVILHLGHRSLALSPTPPSTSFFRSFRNHDDWH